tara:strand:+ start:18 stop:527 length:510 start_codon:yes stop_codon:yes gene_type:complete
MEDKMKAAHERKDELLSLERIDKRDAFLRVLAEWGTVKKACELSGVGLRTYTRWVADDYEFSSKCEEARHTFAESLEEIALERVTNPDKNRGSDVLLLGLLNANMPKKYRPQVQMSDESSKELIHEWRKAAQEVSKTRSEVTEDVDLPLPVEQTLVEILNKVRGKKIEE